MFLSTKPKSSNEKSIFVNLKKANFSKCQLLVLNRKWENFGLEIEEHGTGENHSWWNIYSSLPYLMLGCKMETALQSFIDELHTQKIEQRTTFNKMVCFQSPTLFISCFRAVWTKFLNIRLPLEKVFVFILQTLKNCVTGMHLPH